MTAGAVGLGQVTDVFVAVMSLVGLLVLYLLPSVIAWLRHHDQRTGIIWVNVLFGWTVLGWIVALLWSATSIDPAGPTVPAWRRRRPRSG
jgi:Superinfection immunity protein